MKLIRKLEIHYFRSLYAATMTDLENLNVIFGRNDSGKSNILRALNLFFNDRVDQGRRLDFPIDMSDARRVEAQRTKGRQFIWIKVTMSVPENFRRSLGKEVVIKRQWNRDGQLTEKVWPRDLNSQQSAQLTKLRNQIDFIYIPAIKDLSVYDDLIERMYGAAAETSELRCATDQFVKAIQGQTNRLSEQLTALFGAEARLAPPTEMSRLFRSLDFAYGDERHSLLRQKGDGIKARHIPELLRYINENETKKRYFIWAFEEPENSLDLSAADAEAQRFAGFAAQDNTQVFITSHSPAFYLSEMKEQQDGIRRYFVEKQGREIGADAIRPIDAIFKISDIEEAERRMGDAGLTQLPFVIQTLSEQKRRQLELEKDVERLREKVQALERPTVFVEGAHDVSLFKRCLSRFSSDSDIDVIAMNGTPQSANKVLELLEGQGKAFGMHKVCFLLDNDRQGRKAYRELSGEKSVGNEHAGIGRNVFVWCLPFTREFREFISEFGIPEGDAFFCAEFLVDVRSGAELCAELAREYKGHHKREIESWERRIHGDYWGSLPQEIALRLAQVEKGQPAWLYARGVPDALKGRFFDMVERRGLDISAAEEIIRKIRGILGVGAIGE